MTIDELVEKINQLESTVNLLNSRLIAVANERFFTNKACIMTEMCQECIASPRNMRMINTFALEKYIQDKYTIVNPPITQSVFKYSYSLSTETLHTHLEFSEKHWIHEIESDLIQQCFQCNCKIKVIPTRHSAS